MHEEGLANIDGSLSVPVNRINLTDLNDKMPTFKIKIKYLFLTLKDV